MNLNSWMTMLMAITMLMYLWMLLNLNLNTELNYFFNSDIFTFKTMLNLNSIYFLIGILIISFLVFSWARFYMSNATNNLFFFLMLFLFVTSMLLLTISSSFMMVFLGWEGLGLTSFLLIIFYQNWSSAKGGLLTLLTNRIGDAVLLMVLGYSLMIRFPLEMNQTSSMLLFLMLFLVAMTKSAQFPFMSWLPAAMAAPTPVSALVHSSTLVTAGIWILIRFGQQTMMNISMSFIIGMLTLSVASMTALSETDGKKMVALSTLSQLGLMILTLFMGGVFVCFFHLMMHAFAKANLFTMVGNLIHSRFSQQDIREMLSGLDSSSIVLMNFISILSLSGVVFFSGFFSKEAILVTHYFIMNSFFSYMFLLSIITLTLMYCVKLMIALLMSGISQPVFHKSESLFSLLPSLILCLMSMYLGYFSFSNMMTAIPLKSLSSLYWVALLMFGLFLSYSLGLKTNWGMWFQNQEQIISSMNKVIMSHNKTLSMKSTSSFFESVYLSSSMKPYKGMPLSGYSISMISITCIILIML